MTLKRLVSLIVLVGMLFTGIVPVLAQGTGALTPVVEAFVPNIAPPFGVLTADNLNVELLENAPFLLDVRNPEELAEAGFIEGAVNVPVKEIAQHLDLLPADLDTPIVVYCAKGTRGLFGMTALQLMGYTNVRNLAGGFGAWADAGLPVATEAVEPVVVGPADIDPAVVAEIDAYFQSDMVAS